MAKLKCAEHYERYITVYSSNGYHLGRSYNYINLTVSFAEISTIQRHSVLVLRIETGIYICKRYLLSFSISLNKLPIPAVMGQVLVADAVNRAGRLYFISARLLQCSTYQYLTSLWHAPLTLHPLHLQVLPLTLLAFVLCSLQDKQYSTVDIVQLNYAQWGF